MSITSENTTFPSATSSAEDSRARESASQARAQVSQTPAPVFGESSLEWLANYDRELQSWKTVGLLPLEGYTESLETLPRSGMTRSGKLFRRAPLVRHTHGKGCSLWPTPTASMHQGWSFSRNSKARYNRETMSRALEHGYRPHPILLEALMGFPSGWSEPAPSEMP